jgi:hypothetical protein
VAKEIKTKIAEVRKYLDAVKKEVKHLPDSLTQFEIPHVSNPNFFGRIEELGMLFELWRLGRKGRIAIAGLDDIG